ncbi:sialidase family protein [Parapedobacter tibetensis]|uniref:sialidase family protein n=1 Tax=Parapedobacter tibetensis TaxID=2972951 RepID=UPI00214DB9AF|nr:sialidase family protein [Parapedobacter tibetensis]
MAFLKISWSFLALYGILVVVPDVHSQTLEIFNPLSDQVYSDDFDDETEARSPSHWIENNRHDYWSVVRGDANKAYRVKSNEVSTYSWLHVFEKNVTFDVRFKVVEIAEEDAELKFAVRFNDYEALVYVGYDFKTEKWYIAEQRGKDFEQVNFEQVIDVSRNLEPLKRGDWHNIRVLSNNETVTVYIDDMTRPKLWATDIRHQSPGRVALSAYNATVDFDDVVLNLRSGQGRVNEGVLEYTIGDDDRFREGASIVEKSNGDLLLLHRAEEFHSSDQGQTFTGPYPFSWPKNEHGHHSVLRLQSGKLLNMVAERFGQGARFRAKLSSDDGATWADGGVTWEAYREGLPGKSEVIVMNDKLTQVPGGRVFFVVPARKDDGEKIVGHKTEIYYSDDEGKTWNQSKNDSDDFTKLSRYAEGKVIQTSDGTLRLYTPWTHAHSVRYSESHDNGETWKGDFALDQFRNARSSFALIQDMYASRPTFYMVWVYNNMYDTDIVFLPRSRLGLARSYDGINWEYMMDVERWISPAKKDRRIITQILDPSLTATDKYLYVTIGRSDRAADNGHNHQRLRVYRIEKAKLHPYATWPNEF